MPPGQSHQARVLGADRAMCCAGCKAVAEAIIGMGLDDYYRHRSGQALRPKAEVPDFLQQARIYDRDSVQAEFVWIHDDDARETDLIVEGIVCPACAWLIETRLRALAGIREVTVNFSTHRCHIVWEPSRMALSRILEEIHRLGYSAQPYSAAGQERLLERENRKLLRRLGLAGVLGMQIMMIAVVLYQGAWSGIEPQFRVFFHYLSLALCLPILVYSARPFFEGAIRDLKTGSPGMNVPVSLGLGLAFLGSLHATITNQGSVYYESIAMFVFFLLLSRYFESGVRRRITHRVDAFSRIVPVIASRQDSMGRIEKLAVADLKTGDRIQVKAGETVPVDCVIIDGESTIDESIITGESLPRLHMPGEELLAGMINTSSPLVCEVIRVGRDSMVMQIHDLVNKALGGKSTAQQLINRVATGFVIFIVVLAVAVAAYWLARGADDWLAITVSVLIITCPCALALAMPVAMTAMMDRLLKAGILSRRKDILERFAAVRQFIFDKTGTLTTGKPALVDQETFASYAPADLLSIAVAMEQYSEHPLARAFTGPVGAHASPEVSQVRNMPGAGITALVNGGRYYLGSARFIVTETGLETGQMNGHHPDATRVFLAQRDCLLACFYLEDGLRAETGTVLDSLRQDGYHCAVLSGDRKTAVARVCEQLGITDFMAELGPEEKLEALRQRQQSGAGIMMIGDGINDGPVLAAADLSAAMGMGTDLAKNSADIVFMNDSLNSLEQLREILGRTRSIIRQNLTWAIGYNLLAIPAAAGGMVAPWLAALGMSLSSLIVVLNSARLVR